ncbi:RNA-directed DNA polymerase, eukaryota [Tanacetum coccineum]|uniref:RNA-directed DNA polymerase, eukaryota n=1 Tax=Tanacetum coccineum TaxID=301880 RepID=A0ABQ4Z926_9ASTR
MLSFTNRLVDVLGGIINEVQSAFIKDRQILDGPFILNEVMSWCKKKKKQTLLFKVDFEKAYDSVRWEFSDAVFRQVRVWGKWRNGFNVALISSKGSFIIYGSPTDEFQFGEGLKQGDRYSFFILIIMESLHISFQRVVDAGMFHGIDVGGLVNLSHMFYADDAVFIGDMIKLRSGRTLLIELEDVIKMEDEKLIAWRAAHVSLILESLRRKFFNGPESSGKKFVGSRKKALAPKDNVVIAGYTWLRQVNLIDSRLLPKPCIDIASLIWCELCCRGLIPMIICSSLVNDKKILNYYSVVDVPFMDINSYGEWRSWIDNVKLPKKNKSMFQVLITGDGIEQYFV